VMVSVGSGSMTPPTLLRLADLAALFDVSKQRVNQLRKRADFPNPIADWSQGDLWADPGVRRWARSYYGPSGKAKPRR